jgi:hypothetical protein
LQSEGLNENAYFVLSWLNHIGSFWTKQTHLSRHAASGQIFLAAAWRLFSSRTQKAGVDCFQLGQQPFFVTWLPMMAYNYLFVLTLAAQG